MAKLTARGRFCLAAVSVTHTVPEDDEFGREPGATIKHELRLMSDGVVLEKHTWYKPDGHKDFGDGWTVKGRAFRKGTIRLDETVQRWLAKKEASGYTAV